MEGGVVELLESSILPLSLREDWGARVRVLPQGKEILVGGARLSKGVWWFKRPASVLLRAGFSGGRHNRNTGFHRISTTQGQMS